MICESKWWWWIRGREGCLKRNSVLSSKKACELEEGTAALVDLDHLSYLQKQLCRLGRHNPSSLLQTSPQYTMKQGISSSSSVLTTKYLQFPWAIFILEFLVFFVYFVTSNIYQNFILHESLIIRISVGLLPSIITSNLKPPKALLYIPRLFQQFSTLIFSSPFLFSPNSNPFLDILSNSLRLFDTVTLGFLRGYGCNWGGCCWCSW